MREEVKDAVQKDIKEFKITNEDGKVYIKHEQMLKEHIAFLKREILEKNKEISKLTTCIKNSSSFFQDNKSPWLLKGAVDKNKDFTMDTLPKCTDFDRP